MADPGLRTKKLRLCVLQCSYDSTDSCFKDLDPYASPEAYDKERKYEWSHVHIHKATAARQVRELVQGQQADVFINLCDGSLEEDRAGIEVVQALERHGAAYTGADASFYEPSKAAMKTVAHYAGVRTPPWALFMSIDMQDDALAQEQCSLATSGLRFPLIVKHYSGGGSVGMGQDCRVVSMNQLVGQVRKFVGDFGGALVEEFITGREFTVLVVENGDDSTRPLALTPVECIFKPAPGCTAGEQFKHFELKWQDYESMRWVPLDEKAQPQLGAELRRAAADAFVALRGCSYGRADFRVDGEGHVYFLEHNPNCGVFYPPDAMGSADYILSLDTEIGGHAGFIDRIVGAAQARHRARVASMAAKAEYRHPQGFRLVACRDLGPGDVILKREGAPHVLVSADRVRRVLGPAAVDPALAPSGLGQQPDPHPAVAMTLTSDQAAAGARAALGPPLHSCRWFRAHALPIGSEVWAVWGDSPEQWAPLTTSADPNARLDGLDIVAKRSIYAGETVTLELTAMFGPSNGVYANAACRGANSDCDSVQHAEGPEHAGRVNGAVSACQQG